ncbi:MAG TPA: UDP-galactopyranose mutase [Chryseolinea sp.]|nr:UDP-galactopyranose mutase [Chryseolinea sp.]
MSYDYLVVGAGLSGCVFAERIASQLNKSVLIVDTRDHVGGNCYDYYNSDGILIHKYGPHWFHTNDKRVFEYLSQFTTWRRHDHKVRSFVEGKLYPFPINMDTVNSLYGLNLTTTEAVESFYDSVKIKEITAPRNAEESIIRQVGWDLYNKFYRNYTTKQWGMSPTQLEGSVTSRIPVRSNNDDRYFTDTFQGVPESGYTSMFEEMISSNKIAVALRTDYKTIVDSVSFKKMIYTGSIDYYFDYRFGALPYRSLQFEHQTLDMEYFQAYQQINYPNDFAFTRIVEWKHATGQQHRKTTITKEYPCPHDTSNDKLYPILTKENLQVLAKYKVEAAKLKNVQFCGRLAEYTYYNMDQVVARVLSIFEKQTKPEHV